MQVLSCKQHCAVELASTAGKDEPFEDFLPAHFNYLQFSYYNSEYAGGPSSNVPGASRRRLPVDKAAMLRPDFCVALTCRRPLDGRASPVSGAARASLGGRPPHSVCPPPSPPGEKYEQAVECARTFLLFHPGDEVMSQNLAYYSAVLGEDKARAVAARQVGPEKRSQNCFLPLEGAMSGSCFEI